MKTVILARNSEGANDRIKVNWMSLGQVICFNILSKKQQGGHTSLRGKGRGTATVARMADPKLCQIKPWPPPKTDAQWGMMFKIIMMYVMAHIIRIFWRSHNSVTNLLSPSPKQYTKKIFLLLPDLVPIWNSLPQQFVSASSTAKFHNLGHHPTTTSAFFHQSVGHYITFNKFTHPSQWMVSIFDFSLAFWVFIVGLTEPPPEFHSSRFDSRASPSVLTFALYSRALNCALNFGFYNAIFSRLVFSDFYSGYRFLTFWFST